MSENAVREYKQLLNDNNYSNINDMIYDILPLEDDFGDGTAIYHFEEGVDPQIISEILNTNMNKDITTIFITQL